jgi:hypothetical protein
VDATWDLLFLGLVVAVVLALVVLALVAAIFIARRSRR